MVNYMRGIREGEMKYIVYGDDCDIYYRHKKTLYRISPDCVQMDGSVEYDTISLTVDYVYYCYKKKWGPSPFWKTICGWWKKMASQPEFIIHGTTVYTKPTKDGMCSGVTGTTLFDCVKAVLAYATYVDEVAIDPRLPFDEKKSVEYFRRVHGLEIKEGTWKPTAVDEEMEVVQGVPNENKFLGVRLEIALDGDGEIAFVPSLTSEEWLLNVLVPREPPGNNKELGKNRTRFDRARGLLVTGAIFQEQIRSVINDIINNLPGEALAMRVIDGQGKGMVPTDQHLVIGSEFCYPSSEGVPTLEWVVSLYAEEQQRGEWEYIYPQLQEELEEYKKLRKRMGNFTLTVREGISTLSYTESPYFADEMDEEDLELPSYEAHTSFAVFKPAQAAKIITHKPSQRDATKDVEKMVEQQHVVFKSQLDVQLGRDTKSIVEASPNLKFVGDRITDVNYREPELIEPMGTLFVVTPGKLWVFSERLFLRKYVQMSQQSNATAWMKLYARHERVRVEYEITKLEPKHLPGVEVTLMFDEKPVALAKSATSKDARLLLNKATYLVLRYLAAHSLIPSVNEVGKEVDPPSTTLTLPMGESELPPHAQQSWNLRMEAEVVEETRLKVLQLQAGAYEN